MENKLQGGALATRDGEALLEAATTPPVPGEALPDVETTPPQTPASGEGLAEPVPGKALPRSRSVNFVVTHPSQTRFECPACKLCYTTHNSLACHAAISHAHLTLNISFKCALCDYANGKLRSTSNHFTTTHGATVPPADIAGSNEKACPFCMQTFPSTRSCSMHIKEQHMKEASEQRVREAAEKEKRRGSETARAKWGEGEIARFKEALKRLGPGNNAALAEAVGTRDKHQVTTFKCRFLKANPKWLEENYHPAQPVTNTSSSRRSSTQSPVSIQSRSPATPTTQQPPTRGGQDNSSP